MSGVLYRGGLGIESRNECWIFVNFIMMHSIHPNHDFISCVHHRYLYCIALCYKFTVVVVKILHFEYEGIIIRMKRQINLFFNKEGSLLRLLIISNNRYQFKQHVEPKLKITRVFFVLIININVIQSSFLYSSLRSRSYSNAQKISCLSVTVKFENLIHYSK